MVSLVKKAPPKKAAPAPNAAPVVAQCCAKVSRSIAGCHD